MLVRILQFVIGALLAGGGGYLAWTHRTAGMRVFPPEAAMPWLVIAGVLGLCAGAVLLVSAVHPRPNTRARAEAKAKRRDETLGAAEAYYSQRDRAADSDWRSGDIAAPAEPSPPPAPEPVKMVEPVRVTTPVAATPAASPSAPTAKPVATSAPPEPMAPPLFPSTATLTPIPVASEPPPPPVAEKPAPAPEKPPAAAASQVAATISEPAAAEIAPGKPFEAIKAALAADRPDEAEKLLNAARETAQGLELAELTGLAGDHAAAVGRISNAKWLWRLSLKRFGELGAMDTPAAQAVAENLRTAG